MSKISEAILVFVEIFLYMLLDMKCFANAILFFTLITSTSSSFSAVWLPAGAGEWTVDTNWDTGVVPTDVATFGGTPVGAADVTVASAVQIDEINITNTSGTPYILGATLGTGGPITISAGGSINKTGTIIGFVTLPLTLESGSAITMSSVAPTSAPLVVSSTISGPGSGGITKSGTGRMNLTGTGSNIYAGTTTISSGELGLGKTGVGVIAIPGDVIISGGSLIYFADDQLADTSNITINSGSMTMFGFSDTFSSLTINGGGVPSYTGSLSFNSTGTALTLRNTGLTGTGSASINLTGGSGGDIVFDATNNGTAVITVPFFSLGSVTRTFNIDNGSASIDMFITSVISGVGGVTKTGAGFLSFNGGAANTFSGLTTVSAGTLSLEKPAGVNAVGGNVLVNGGTLTQVNAGQIPTTASATVSSGTFDLGSNALTLNSLTFSGGSVINNSVSLSLESTGTALIMGNGVSLSGQFNLTGGSGGDVVYNGTSIGATIAAVDLGSVTRIFDVASGANPGLNITGAITKTGSTGLTKNGTGILTLSGTSSLSGGTVTAQSGTLIVNGSLTSATLGVDSGATLGGSGTITADVTISSGGTSAPGGSIGKLTITGDYTQSSGSTFLTEIDDQGNSDQIRVIGGLVTIESGATLDIDPLPGIFLPGTMYTIIDADIPIVGEFDTIIFTIPGLAASLEQNSNLVLTLLEVGRFVDLDTLVTGNARQVAICLDTQSIFPDTDLDVVATALQPLVATPSKLQDALDQLQPAIFAALNLVQEDQMSLMQSSFSHRLQAWGNGGCSELNPNTWNLWVTPLGEFIDQRSHSQQVGYSTDAYGVMIGTDRKFLNHLHTGIAAGYVYNDVDWKRSRGEVCSHNVYGAAYGAWQAKAFHVLASIVGGWNDYHGFRHMKFTTLNRKAKHSNEGYVFGGHLEGAYSINRNKIRLQPFGSLEYTYSTQKGYKEHGSGVLDLKVRRKSSERFRSHVGLDLSQCFPIHRGQIIPNVYVSWIWEKEMKSGQVKASFVDFDCTMRLSGFRPVRSLFAPGAGITFTFLNESISLALRWDGEFGKRYSNQKALIQGTFGF